MDIAGAYLVTSLIVLGLIVYVIILIFVSIAIANAARNKGQSWALFFWLSFLVNWFIMLIVMLLIKKDTKQTSFVEGDLGSTPVACEFCKENIRADAIVCKHCGRDVKPQLERLQKEVSDRARAAVEAEQKAIAEKEQKELEEKMRLQQTKDLKREKRRAFFKSRTFFVAVSLVLGSVIVTLGYFVIQSQIRAAQFNDWQSKFLECEYLLPENTFYEIGKDNKSASVEYQDLASVETKTWLRCLGAALNPEEQTSSLAGVLLIADQFNTEFQLGVVSGNVLLEEKIIIFQKTP